MVEMVDELMERKGYMFFSGVIHQAVIDMYSKAFPSYVREPAARETPGEKVRRKAEQKEAAAAQAREGQLAIVEQLGGTVVTKDGGNEMARYYTYTGKKRFEQEVALDQISSDLVKTQYFPSKEKVLALQAEGKTDYD